MSPREYEARADEADRDMEAEYGEEMRYRARAELLNRCSLIDDEVAHEYALFCAACRQVTPEQYVDDLRKIGHEYWERELAAQWEAFYEAME